MSSPTIKKQRKLSDAKTNAKAERQRILSHNSVPLRDPAEATSRWGDERGVRVRILADTVHRLDAPAERFRLQKQASVNLEAWSVAAHRPLRRDRPKVHVEQADVLDAVATHTKTDGALYAAINMANEKFPGGGYTKGCAAQEENMARRSDMHFTFDAYNLQEDHAGHVVYTDAMSSLVAGEHGVVHMSREPLVCIKGSETHSKWVADRSDDASMGYALLGEKDVFPFLELRSAAVKVRDNSILSEVKAEMRKRIDAQFRTLKQNGVRRVVLSAFGCGAFGNEPRMVAQLYKEAIANWASALDKVVFAIFYAGRGENNYAIFRSVLEMNS